MELGIKIDTEKESKNFTGEFQVVPPGWYTAVIVKSELKTTKAGTGKYVEFVNEIQGGDFNGSTVIDRLNIINQNETAQNIGRASLSAIAVNIGHKGELMNTDVLHGRPYQIKVAIQEFKSNNTGEMLKSNTIRDYRAAKKSENVSRETSGEKNEWF